MFRLGGIPTLTRVHVPRVTGKEGVVPKVYLQKQLWKLRMMGFCWLVGCLVVVSCERLHNLFFKEILCFSKLHSLHSLETNIHNSSPLKIGQAPKGNNRIPTIRFQV